MAQSEVDICNLALAHLGAETLISSIDPPDGTVEANYCRTFYPVVRRAALSAGNFDFSLKRAALALKATNPSTKWLYAYAVPSDCLTALRVLRNYNVIDTTLTSYSLGYYNEDPVVEDAFRERESSEFEIEGSTLLTNEPDAVLKYVADVTDRTGDFPPQLVMAMSMLLAGYLAGPIIKGAEGRAAGQTWMRAGEVALARAAATDGNSRNERAEFVDAFTKARR